jgi:hypothetical protein
MIRLALLVLLGLLATGCVEEGVVMCVDSHEPDAFDAIELTVTLARDDADSGPVCRAATAQFSASSLEYCVAIAPGARFTAAIFLRAQGFLRGELIANREATARFSDGDQLEAPPILLDPSCCASDPCDACMPDGQCLQGECVGVPRRGVFEEAANTGEANCE